MHQNNQLYYLNQKSKENADQLQPKHINYIS